MSRDQTTHTFSPEPLPSAKEPSPVGTAIKDRSVGLILLIFAGIGIVESLRLGLGTPGQMGSGSWLLITAVVMGLFSFLIVLLPQLGEPFSKEGTIRVLMFSAFLLAYALTLTHIGFLISSTLFGITAVWIAKDRNAWRVLGGPLLTTVIIYSLFTFALDVRLP